MTEVGRETNSFYRMFDNGRRAEYEEDGGPPRSPGKEGITPLFGFLATANEKRKTQRLKDVGFSTI
ncbi:hypothetical protein [Paenibacillus cellulositrophicus]|uniref:hypothetical protein n=1 Tax=Paenibacillus cellulositrophicus TaxID=562959 RepID=UPI00126724DF|nr:hypothetical protein [Paenibacillus cellulositrophicus]